MVLGHHKLLKFEDLVPTSLGSGAIKTCQKCVTVTADYCGTNSLQLFVVEFDTCLVWELLSLPSNAQTAPDLPSLKGNRWGVISAV